MRHKTNLGAAWNFRYCLENANTPYFMWLGGHDLLPPGYVQTLTAGLDRNPGAVLAYPAVQHIDVAGQPLRRYEYRFSGLLQDERPLRRVTATVAHLDDCTLIHGLFRREILLAVGMGPFLGGDHVLLTKAAARGPLIYCPETQYVRRQVHTDDSMQKQLQRIDPDATVPQSHPRAKMAEEQLAIYADRRLGSWLPRTLWKLVARYELLRRFSPWPSGSAGEALLNQVLFFLARVVHRTKRMLQWEDVVART
jgi:hypothetical protein